MTEDERDGPAYAADIEAALACGADGTNVAEVRFQAPATLAVAWKLSNIAVGPARSSRILTF